MLCYITLQWLERPSCYHGVMFDWLSHAVRQSGRDWDYGTGPIGYSMLGSFSKERKSVTAKTVNPLTAMLAARSLKTEDGKLKRQV